MKRYMSLGLAITIVALALAGLAPNTAAAQMVPDTADPYELAPQNVHLYPVSLNARIPYYYLPPIFAPAPMWRGAMTAEDIHAIAPHNYVAYEIPDMSALVAWGTVKGDERVTLEAANKQEFIILPPENLDDGSSFFLMRTSMRYVPRCTAEELAQLIDRELMLGPSRVQSIAEQLPVDVLLYEYERVSDVADIQPQLNEILQGIKNDADGLAIDDWPVEDIYINYSGWRRNANRMRTMGDFVPNWFTVEGKMVAHKIYQGGSYLLTVEFEGYNPWFPIETAKNAMRKLIGLSFDEFVEPNRYYDVELPLNGKEWHRQGSGLIKPYDTRRHVGTGSAGQGAY